MTGADASLQDVREAMLRQLQGCRSPHAARLRLRVGCTCDPTSLWHLRPRLMEALAVERGEWQARRCVAAVDEVFRRHWPDAPVSRSPALH